MSNYKTDSGANDCRKNESGICDEGTAGTGLISINGDTTSAQSIVGGTNVNISSISGTTTISATGSAAGTVTGMTAPQMFTTPVNETVGGVLQLVYSGTPMALSSTSNGLLESTQENLSSGASAEAGFAGKNDQGDLMELVMSGSGNTRRGIIRTASSAFGTDIQQQGTGKNIRLMTDGTARATIDDAGLNATLGATAPSSVSATTVTASTPIAVTSGGIGTNTITAHYIMAGAGTSTPALINPSTSGYVLTSTGASSDPTFQAPAAITNPLPVAQGGTSLQTLTAHSVLVGEGTSAVGLVDPSTSGYVLTSNGASADPSFQPAAGTGINQVVFQATTTFSGSIASNSTSTVSGWSASIDTASAFSSGTYTIPYTGYYNVYGQMVFASTYSGFDGYLFIGINGTSILTGHDFHQAVNGVYEMQVAGVISCIAGDLVTLKVSQVNSDAISIALSGTAADTLWSITSIGGQNAGGGGGGSLTSFSANSTLTGLQVAVTNPTTTPALTISYSGTPFLVADGGTGTTTSTGSGSVVLSTSPALTTPALGTPQSGTMTNVSGTANALVSGYAINLSAGSAGAIVYQSLGAVTAYLANGSNGQVLTSSGGASAPTWTSVGANLLTSNNTWTGTNQFDNTTTLNGVTTINNDVNVGTNNTITLGAGSVIMLGTGGQIKIPSAATIKIYSGGNVVIDSGAYLDMNGNLLLGGSAGSVGQVLKSNGSGNAPSWVSQLNIFATNNTWTGTNTFNNTTTLNGSNIWNGITQLGNQLYANGTPGTYGQFLVSQG